MNKFINRCVFKLLIAVFAVFVAVRSNLPAVCGAVIGMQKNKPVIDHHHIPQNH